MRMRETQKIHDEVLIYIDERRFVAIGLLHSAECVGALILGVVNIHHSGWLR